MFTLRLYPIACLLAATYLTGGVLAAADNKHSRVAAAWYAGWHADSGYPLSKVSWSKYTHLTYAFACVWIIDLYCAMGLTVSWYIQGNDI